MARSDHDKQRLTDALAQNPPVRLLGTIEEATLTNLLDQLDRCEAGDGPIAVELTTTGGDAEIGRRLALEIRLARERLGRRIVFVGKTTVYSAGATMMSAFPVEDRFFTADTVLLIHCRKFQQTLELEGPLKASWIRAEQLMTELANGMRVEREGYEALIEGSDISLEEIEREAEKSWYLPANEALRRRLIGGII